MNIIIAKNAFIASNCQNVTTTRGVWSLLESRVGLILNISSNNIGKVYDVDDDDDKCTNVTYIHTHTHVTQYQTWAISVHSAHVCRSIVCFPDEKDTIKINITWNVPRVSTIPSVGDDVDVVHHLSMTSVFVLTSIDWSPCLSGNKNTLIKYETT